MVPGLANPTPPCRLQRSALTEFRSLNPLISGRGLENRALFFLQPYTGLEEGGNGAAMPGQSA